MAVEFETVDIWLGQLRCAADLETISVERYTEDGDQTLEFARLLGEDFIDHDLVERSYTAGSHASAHAAVAAHSFSSSYAGAVEAAWAGAGSVNAVVLVWGGSLARPRSLVVDDGALRYLGRFGCDPSEPSVATERARLDTHPREPPRSR